MSPSKADRRIDSILTAAKQVLDISKDLLGFCPILGLPGVASVLSTLIDMILKVRGNEETRRDLAKKVAELASVLERTMKQAIYVPETDDRTRRRLVTSPELEKRISTLKSDLEDLTNKAEELQEGSFRGFLLSKRNAEMLSNIRVGIEDATRKFSIEGEITIELLVNGIVNAHMHDDDERVLERLAPVNAGYASALNPTTAGTLPGTRTALIEELEGWTLRSRSNQGSSFIYVVSGGAGTGKSTIAFEMAQRLEKAGALGASFFFVHGANKLNTTTHVLRTIAYQLARKQKDLYPHITAAAQEYAQGGKQGEQLQVDLEDLIIKPLRNVHPSHRPIALVLDALDECTDAAQKDVVRLLYLFMQQLPKIPFPVRVLVTSRPEMHIQDALNDENIRKISKPLKLHQISRVIVDADIKLFLVTRLQGLKCYKDIYGARPTVIEDLTTRAAGLFIYAATIISFLDRNQELAVEILNSLLSDSPSRSAFNLVDLDKLYIVVLRRALDKALEIPDMENHIRFVLGGLALLQDYVPARVLQDLVGEAANYVKYILRRLGSVIVVPENDDEEVRILHASFPQFLTNDKRCNDLTFYIDPSIHHRRLALACLKVMTPLLKRNICALEDVTIMKSDIRGLEDAIKRCISPSLQYSCAHWATHLSQCNHPDLEFLNAVTDFVRTKLLVWVEALSYMGRLEVAVPALLAALSWCEVNMQDEGQGRYEVLQLIDDTHRIVLQCYIPIDKCPEHIYISASLLAPSCVSIAQYNHSNNNHPTIKAMTPRDSIWGTYLHTIPVHSVDCRAMLSPDGSLIASGSRNGLVGIWDASIGLWRRTLFGHTEGVLCVAWSPDGQSLASGSVDGTIRVWNATSGAQVHVQRVQNGNCEACVIAWRRDGKQLVTGVDPGGVQVWDVIVGKEFRRRVAVPSIETVMTISEDARHAVDWTARGLRVWDIECDDGRILKEVPVQFLVYSAVFLHNDTQVAFCGQDKAIHMWDLESDECTPKVEPESRINRGDRIIEGIALSQNGNTLASSTGDLIHLFDTKSWDLLGSFQGSFYMTASFSPDNHRLLTSYSTIRMLDLSSVFSPKLRITPTLAIVKHESTINFLAISLDGKRVAAMSRGTVSIWSLQSASLFCTIQGSFVGGTTFSPDAQKIAVGENDKISIWDITTTQPILMQTIPTAQSVGDRITWSSDGYWIACAAYGPDNITRRLGVFDAVTGQLVKYLMLSNQEALWSLEFSHDNTMLCAQYGLDETIFKWKEGNQVNLEQHRWETEIKRREKFHKDAWIIREPDGKRLCWVQQPYSERLVRWGNYYVVGQDSGRLDILHIEESSVDAVKSS